MCNPAFCNSSSVQYGTGGQQREQYNTITAVVPHVPYTCHAGMQVTFVSLCSASSSPAVVQYSIAHHEYSKQSRRCLSIRTCRLLYFRELGAMYGDKVSRLPLLIRFDGSSICLPTQTSYYHNSGLARKVDFRSLQCTFHTSIAGGKNVGDRYNTTCAETLLSQNKRPPLVKYRGQPKRVFKISTVDMSGAHIFFSLVQFQTSPSPREGSMVINSPLPRDAVQLISWIEQ